MTLTDNLVSYYKFDGDATDSVGSNDLTAVGVTNGASYGKINQGYLFDSMSDRLTIPTLSGITTDMSISIWVNPTTVNSDYNYNTIFAYRYLLIRFSSTKLYWWTSLGDVAVSQNNNFNINNWYHIVITQSGKNYVMYVNGVTIGSGTTTSNLVFTLNDANAGFGYYTTGKGILAKLDEPAIWSRALTSTEVTELYNSGSGLQYPFSTGWTGKIIGTTNPSKIIDTAVANISKINGV